MAPDAGDCRGAQPGMAGIRSTPAPRQSAGEPTRSTSAGSTTESTAPMTRARSGAAVFERMRRPLQRAYRRNFRACALGTQVLLNLTTNAAMLCSGRFPTHCNRPTLLLKESVRGTVLGCPNLAHSARKGAYLGGYNEKETRSPLLPCRSSPLARSQVVTSNRSSEPVRHRGETRSSSAGGHSRSDPGAPS